MIYWVFPSTMVSGFLVVHTVFFDVYVPARSGTVIREDLKTLLSHMPVFVVKAIGKEDFGEGDTEVGGCMGCLRKRFVVGHLAVASPAHTPTPPSSCRPPSSPRHFSHVCTMSYAVCWRLCSRGR